jgi:hypothetical protein
MTSRADSKLKRLPLPLMAALVDRLGQPGVTAKDALAWLAEQPDGVRSSAAALSQSWDWIVARVAAWKREQQASAFMEAAKEQFPELSQEQIFALGQKHFAMASIAASDARSWQAVQKLDLDKKSLALDEQKFQRETAELFLKWYADRRAAEVANSTSSHAEKIARLGQLMFGPDFAGTTGGAS